MTGDGPEGSDGCVRERLDRIRSRSEKSTPWRPMVHHVVRLVNREGVVPVKTRLSRDDLAFLAAARDDVLAFAELGLRLVDLHQPRDGGGISSDARETMRRCRACMWRWPCPTFRAVEEAVDRPPA